jgi:tRNA pseudouridine55 synthase
MRRHKAVIEKRAGETPLEALRAWQAAHPQYAGLPACYAGRLDPLASGKLLVLFGDECKRKERHTKLDKEYEIEVALDFATDTGDALGLPAYAERDTHPDQASLRRALKAVCGTHQVPYPAFSSKTADGVPLFLHALGGTLDEIEIPVHPETVHSVRILGMERLSRPALEERIVSILAFETIPDRSFLVLSLRVRAASGTYMRTLADRIAAELGTRGFALSIRRTHIGRRLPLGLWFERR